ncbi:Acetyl-CoA acetyltransferase [Zhongshania aliphaticivorans]|uniref:Acetyl-CoA acetyltransferase n=1 Tax=Zhongshania aliphaticivorans TaxID=1470434 RepID=A0A5S9NAA8_9GAMM|nr:thiolase family protein [Zhongshania aliphaticivorans]CAA0087060.1 Acetyl-CoA acetyltransferase [Zhongshania aliphaticivorans]CAA0114001.1 Acetyl-CoA acetyltransferase [Zhongshania aliphaticivorans]
MSDSVYIVSGARTPMGGMLGSLSSLTAVELGTTAITAAVKRANIDTAKIDDVIMGCVLPAGLKQGPARQAAIGAGIPESTGAVTINKLCGSGMQATIYAHDQIKAGSCDIIVAGGMESMTNAPHLVLNARKGVGTGGKGFEDHMFFDGLQDAYSGRMMGSFAQQTADENNFTREEMDAYAIESTNRACNAIKNGYLTAETAPVTVKSRKGETIVSDDEQPLKASLEKIPTLRPAFAKDGTITAANASSISDGASAMVLMNEKALKDTGATPQARIIAHSRQSMAPDLFTVAPVGAMQKLLAKTGWTKDDVDLWEINEAFAMVTMLAIRELDIDHAKVNVHGGACAQGHPVGSTGSRIIISLVHALQQYGKKRGIASLCIGGGEALAVAIELI